MQHLRVTSPSRLADQIISIFAGDPAVSQVVVMRGASIQPAGDVILADVAREAVNELIDRLGHLGVPEHGTIHIDPVTTWVSRAGYDSERHTPGSSADAVVVG